MSALRRFSKSARRRPVHPLTSSSRAPIEAITSSNPGILPMIIPAVRL